MADDKWRYILTRLYGDGTEEILDPDLPLQSPSITLPVSGAEMVNGSIKWETARLKKNGEPIFQSWNTAIYAEKSGVIRGASIVADVIDSGGQELELETVGFAGYPTGMPYFDDKEFVYTDSFDIVRHIWDHMQGMPGGNLGIKMPTGKSGVTFGEPARDVSFETGAGETVEFEAGPYKINFWSNDDLGRVIDDLAGSTPFEFRVRSKWNSDKRTIGKELQLGAPRLGVRREDLRFVVGENVAENPEITRDGDMYATDVVVYGAGEGRKMRRAEESVPGAAKRVRRVAVLADKSLSSDKMTKRIARELARRYNSNMSMDSFTVQNHPNAPFGSYEPGDEIMITTADGWHGPSKLWVRILEMVIDPIDDSVELEVVRTDRV